MADYEEEERLEEHFTINSNAIQEDVGTLVRSKLSNEEWSPVKVGDWVDDLTESILKNLSELKKPFKYIVNCVIMQRTGAALSAGFTSVWDNTKDGMVHVPFENDTLHVLVTVYFLKLD